MTEPMIVCPQCKSEIKLTESLAAPLIDSTRKDYEQRLAKKDADFANRETSLRTREEELSKAKESMTVQIAEQVRQERIKITAEEAKKARDSVSTEMAELQETMRRQNEKLAEAQQVQASCLAKERALADEKREMDLTIERKTQEGIDAAREQAKAAAAEESRLRLAEKDKTISDMHKQIEDLRRKAEQGSQQLQGEVQELEIEALLTAKFPFDIIQPVAKGEHGGDVLHRVVNSFGQPCGTILWEFKRTKNWTDSWLAKLRDDQRAAKAEIAIIVSQALPKGVETFELIEGVWVTHPRVIFPVAMILRHTLIEQSAARQTTEGQQTKMEMTYQYLTGPRFRQRVEAIVEAFSSMKEDLDREKKVFTKQWAKRDEQIDRVMQSTVGMYGDLQGIAGKSLQEIEGLEMRALGEPIE